MEQVQQAGRRVLAVRRQVEQVVTGPRVSSDRQEILQAADALAGAIQTARAAARQGDIFSPTIAADFRRQIQSVLTRDSRRAVDLVADRAPTTGVRWFSRS